MQIEDYKPNSNAYKRSQTDEQPIAKNIKKVVRGRVTTRKKSVSQKFVDLFFAEDVENIKEYLIFDVMIPMIKDGIVDTVKNVIDMAFYGRISGSRKGGQTYVSYNNYSSGNRRQQASSERRVKTTYKDIVFETRADAEDVLDMMREVLDKYQNISIADFYDCIYDKIDDSVKIVGNGYTDNHYGWMDLTNAKVVRCRDGYLLDLPRAIEID